MEAAAGHLGELVALADAVDIGAGEHEGFSRFRVGDGVDAADLLAALVGFEQFFFILGFHSGCSPVGGAGFGLVELAPSGVLYITSAPRGVYGAWSGENIRIIKNLL